jgi:hypothetical protein
MPYSASLACVDPARIADIWPHARHLIKSAIDQTGLSDFAEFEGEILSGKQLLWLAIVNKSIEAAATTHLTLTNGDKVCVLTACAGHNRANWLPLLQRLEAFAKDEGCAVMRIFGRKGWHRVLDGYHVEHVVLEKELA